MNDSIKLKSKNSFLALAIRSGVMYFFQFISLLLLARWLSPEDYGIFGVVNSWISLSYFFCDIGISGALIQQIDHPTKKQLATCLSIQMLLSTSIAIGFFFIAPFLAHHHKLGNEGIWMIRTLCFAIPIFALRGIPKIFFQRDIEFKTIAKIELTESFFSYLTQITLAFSGFAVWSFIIANSVKAIIGTTLYIKKCPQLPIPKIDFKILSPLLKYGIPFQLNGMITSSKVLIVPLVLGSLLSMDQIGIITWTTSLAIIPMILIVNYNQVIFPSLSRLQFDKTNQITLASRGMELAILGLGIVFGLFATCSTPGIDFFFPEKWDLAKILFPLAVICQSFIGLSYLCASILNATGKPTTRLWIELFTAIIEFITCWIAVYYYQEKGYFICRGIVNFISLTFTYYKSSHLLRTYTFIRLIIIALICVSGHYLVSELTNNLWSRFICFSSYYLLTISILDRGAYKDIIWIIRNIKTRLKQK